MKKIQEGQHHNIDWLLEDDNHSLNSDGNSNAIKFLIDAINEMQTEIEQLKTKVEELNHKT